MTSILSTMARRTAGTVAGIATGSAMAFYWSAMQPAKAPNNTTTTTETTSGSTSTPSSNDPYEHLPAVDEPTHCTICRTNRNGPCRNLWRKFEYCMKDHPPSSKAEQEKGDDDNNNSHDNDEDHCTKYMMEWIPCVRQHFLLYAMYANQQDADYYDRMDQLMEPAQPWVKPDIDWTDYLAMISKLKLNVVDIYTAGLRANDPLWTEEDTTDSNDQAVQVFVRVQLHDDDLPIAISYARDDVGNIIGVGHFQQTQQDNNEGAIVNESTMTMTFRPNKTRRIRLYKVYEEELGENEPERPLKKRVYASEEIDLLQVARANGKFNPNYEWDGAENGEQQDVEFS